MTFYIFHHFFFWGSGDWTNHILSPDNEGHRGKDGSFMLTCKEGPCKNHGHCTSENAIQAAATCACSEHIHQELGSYNWRSDGLKSQALCKLGNHKQPGFLSEPCHEALLFYTHPCICEGGLPLPHAVASTPFSLPFSSIGLLFSETKNRRKRLWKKCKLMIENKKIHCPTNCLSMTEEYELSTYESHKLTSIQCK